MRTASNELRIFDGHGGLQDTAVEACSRRWNHRDGCSALDFHCVGTETESQYVRCREVVSYECRLVELLTWMCEQCQLDDSPVLWYYVVGRPCDSVWFTVDHDCWARDCDLVMQPHARQRPEWIFVECHNVKLFATPPRDRTLMYVPVRSV